MPTLFHGRTNWGSVETIEAKERFSKAGVEFLRKLANDSTVEPVWATTWQHWANYYFAKAFAIRELPVAVKTVEGDEHRSFHCSPHWKSVKLAEQFSGRPLIWLDDNPTDRPNEAIVNLRAPKDRALTLFYQVNPYTGLTSDDVKAIEEWLELASTEPGQKELRLTRAKALRKDRSERLKLEKAFEKSKAMRLQTLARAQELFPEQTHLCKALATLGGHKLGLTDASLAETFKRYSVQTDVKASGSFLRDSKFHQADFIANSDDF